MSALETLLRFTIRLAQHPVVNSALKHAIRLGTAELVKQVQRQTRGGVRSPQHVH